MAVAILLVGCSKQNISSGNSPSPAKERASAAFMSPVAQAALSSWQRGDQSAAVSSFLAADWSVRPIFASDSVLNLTEDKFKSLSVADQQAKSAEIGNQLGSLKRLAAAVTQAGRDAAAKGDTTQAQNYFTSLKQCGAALNSPDSLIIVQLVGNSLDKMADTELAKIGK